MEIVVPVHWLVMIGIVRTILLMMKGLTRLLYKRRSYPGRYWGKGDFNQEGGERDGSKKKRQRSSEV